MQRACCVIRVGLARLTQDASLKPACRPSTRPRSSCFWRARCSQERKLLPRLRNFAFNRTSRRILPAAEAARSNSTGAASCRLHLATRCVQLIGGKRHAAPASASRKAARRLTATLGRPAPVVRLLASTVRPDNRNLRRSWRVPSTIARVSLTARVVRFFRRIHARISRAILAYNQKSTLPLPNDRYLRIRRLYQLCER